MKLVLDTATAASGIGVRAQPRWPPNIRASGSDGNGMGGRKMSLFLFSRRQRRRKQHAHRPWRPTTTTQRHNNNNNRSGAPKQKSRSEISFWLPFALLIPSGSATATTTAARSWMGLPLPLIPTFVCSRVRNLCSRSGEYQGREYCVCEWIAFTDTVHSTAQHGHQTCRQPLQALLVLLSGHNTNG